MGVSIWLGIAVLAQIGRQCIGQTRTPLSERWWTRPAVPRPLCCLQPVAAWAQSYLLGCWAPPCICCCIWLRSLVGNTLWAVVLGHRAQECFDAGRSTSVRSTCCGKQAAGPLLSSNNCVNCVAKRIPEADEFFFVLPTGNALSCGHSHLASVFAPLGSYYTVAEWNSSTTCQDLRQLCLGE